MIDDTLVANFIRHVEDSRTNGVPELHFRFWRRAPEAAREQYLRRFRNDPDAMSWFEEGYLADDPDFDALLALPCDTLGHLYAQHVIDGRGEMALQAFTLAQRQLPYASLWMATLTSQMTFLHPDMTSAVMDRAHVPEKAVRRSRRRTRAAAPNRCSHRARCGRSLGGPVSLRDRRSPGGTSQGWKLSRGSRSGSVR